MFPVHAHRLSMGRGCGSVAVQRSSRRSQIFVVHADSIYIWYTFFHVTKETAANSYVMLTIICSDSYLKPWKNRLANRRKFLSTCTSFGRPLALTLVEPKLARTLTQVFHRLATQRRSTQVDRKSTVYAWNLVRLAWTFESTCKTVRPPNQSQVCTQVLVLQICVDLRVRLANFTCVRIIVLFHTRGTRFQ